MSRLNALKGLMRTFFWLTKEEWRGTDHKFYRLAFGAIGFVVMALFWFYFIRNFLPSPFH